MEQFQNNIQQQKIVKNEYIIICIQISSKDSENLEKLLRHRDNVKNQPWGRLAAQRYKQQWFCDVNHCMEDNFLWTPCHPQMQIKALPLQRSCMWTWSSNAAVSATSLISFKMDWGKAGNCSVVGWIKICRYFWKAQMPCHLDYRAEEPSSFLWALQTTQSLKVLGCVSADGTGSLHIWRGTINAERQIQVSYPGYVFFRYGLAYFSKIMLYAFIATAWLHVRGVRVLNWPAVDNFYPIKTMEMKNVRKQTQHCWAAKNPS